jgi:hypothetical protein
MARGSSTTATSINLISRTMQQVLMSLWWADGLENLSKLIITKCHDDLSVLVLFWCLIIPSWFYALLISAEWVCPQSTRF